MLYLGCFFRFAHDIFGLVIIVAISSFISPWEVCTDTLLVLSVLFKNLVIRPTPTYHLYDTGDYNTVEIVERLAE